MSRKIIFVGLFAIAVLIILFVFLNQSQRPAAKKLYWFIPDGMRADPNLFNIYKWAQEGKLPNIKRMMDEGSYGYSIPDFPSHTPVNFASLLTGTHPVVHGVSDGTMRLQGYPLLKPSLGGFWSSAKKVAPIWTVLENASKKVVLLSIPGSTPPELKKGITIRGRWGNWGSDDPALIFMPTELQAQVKSVGKGFRLFYFGDTLTKFVPEGTSNLTQQPELKSYSPVKEAQLAAHALTIYAFIIDSTDDNKTNYDEVAYSFNESGPAFAVTKQQEWTEWYPINLTFQNQTYDSDIKLTAIKIWDNGQFRIRVLYNNLNKFVTDPDYVAKDMTDKIGPMIDFVDNYPPQLIFLPEDKNTFLEESQMSLDYHKKAVDYVYDNYAPDVFLQDIYTPNQMLTSRWWMRYIDPTSPDFTPEKNQSAMDDVLKMYQGLDAIIGEALKHDDGNTLFVLSSDHGIILQRRTMALNNLFAQKGWLNFSVDSVTGETIIDWNHTKVLYLQTNYIYINPNNLAGPYQRASGPEYEKLRNEVILALQQLTDNDGTAPIVHVSKWEDAPQFFDIPSDRVGDLVIEIAPGYGFSEAATNDLKVFTDSLVSGNKQGFDPKTDGMQTPFIIMGPGIRHGYQLTKSISHVDQMPTILTLMGIKVPDYVQGRVLTEIMR